MHEFRPSEHAALCGNKVCLCVRIWGGIPALHPLVEESCHLSKLSSAACSRVPLQNHTSLAGPSTPATWSFEHIQTILTSRLQCDLLFSYTKAKMDNSAVTGLGLDSGTAFQWNAVSWQSVLCVWPILPTGCQVVPLQTHREALAPNAAVPCCSTVALCFAADHLLSQSCNVSCYCKPCGGAGHRAEWPGQDNPGKESPTQCTRSRCTPNSCSASSCLYSPTWLGRGTRLKACHCKCNMTML